MTRFNAKKVTTPNAVSYEGGAGYEKNPLEEWMNFLFSSYLEDRFYENASVQTSRFINLTNQMVKEYGADFVANAALFARNELGMRSVSQLVAALLNDKKLEKKRVFYRNYPHRADDVAEVFAAIDSLKGKRSHALVRGCGDYISGLSAHSLGKYKLNSREYNMFDIINITHATSPVIDKYKAGTLETPDTWEVAISGASDEDSRKREWVRLVEEGKLGYLALIRNIRNILDSDVDEEWVDTYLVPQLKDEEAIRKSLVFPYQIYAAHKSLSIHPIGVVHALSDAFKIAVKNMPKLNGDTLVILDVSGSMDSPISKNSNIRIKEAGAVYAACILLNSENSDFIKFGSMAKKRSYNKLANIFDTISMMVDNENCGYGTEIGPAYGLINRKYDRIILISDMQIMSSRYCWSRDDGNDCYRDYCREYGETPIYSFDLGNYHVQTDNPNNPNVYLCTSLSEKTLKFIQLLEEGEDLVDYINENYDYRVRH